MTDATGATAPSLTEKPDPGQRKQWIQLLPSGRFAPRDHRGPYRLSDPPAVIQATVRMCGKTEMVVDYDHGIDLAAKHGQPALAAGWIKGLEARDGGIWGLVEWTTRAAELVSQKEYRYISPVFLHRPDGTITALLRAALTNNPALDLQALCSQGATVPPDTTSPTNREALGSFSQLLTAINQAAPPVANFAAELRKLLSLDATATDADVLAKVRELCTAACSQVAAPDPAAYVPLGEFERVVTELNKMRQGISKSAAETKVAAAMQTGNMLPFLKDWAVALCQVNEPAFDAFIQKTSPDLQRLWAPSPSFARRPDATGIKAMLTDEQRAVCSSMGLDEGEYAKTLSVAGAGR